MISATIPSVFATILLLMAAKFVIKLLSPSNKQFPPGPPPKFLIGNALDIPLSSASRVYYQWTKQYNSSIISLTALGTRFFVLHRREDADELLENRAKYYSDRPILPTIEMVGWDYNFGLYQYGEKWRTHRRIAHQSLRAQSAIAFQPIQTKKVNDMLVALLDTPDRFDDHGKLLSISIPIATMFGYDVKTLDDPVINAADEHLSIGEAVVGIGGSFANIFPPLKYVPWTWTQRMAKKCIKLSDEMKRVPLEALMKSMANGTAIHSFVGEFMEKKQTVGAAPGEEDAVLNIAHTVYGAASDTTISATRTFFYLLATHPEVQAKAQAELDRVIGQSLRLPTFDDRPSLPYMDAIYREVLRWCPPLSMGVAHVAALDDTYKGYFIPKGSVILTNLWAMGQDEEHYGPDVHAFNPDRFIDKDGHLDDNDRILAYGFGKRVCVGKHVASSTLWLMMASILTCFNLHKKRDQTGKEIEINDEFREGGFFAHKTPHECGITPRSDVWREMIDLLRSQGS